LVWPLSSGGPGLKLVAQLVTVCAPASSLTAGGVLAVEVGAVLAGVAAIVEGGGGLGVGLGGGLVPLVDRGGVAWAGPLGVGGGVKVSRPVGEMAGPVPKSPGLVLPVTVNVRVCPLSSAGPALMPVAQAWL